MTETAENTKEAIQLNVSQDLTTATIAGTKVDIAPGGNVTIYTNELSVQTKPAEENAVTEDSTISLGDKFDSVATYGAKVSIASDGGLVVATNGKVQVKPPVANAAAAEATAEQTAEAPAKEEATEVPAEEIKPEAGTKYKDGCVFAGTLEDGKEVFAAPLDTADADGNTLLLSFNDAVKLVAQLNKKKGYLGHKDWHIPTQEELAVLQKGYDKGGLKGTFDEGLEAWYMTSTPFVNSKGDVTDSTWGDSIRRTYQTHRLPFVKGKLRIVHN